MIANLSVFTSRLCALGATILAMVFSHTLAAQALIATPASIDFGNTVIGSTATRTVTLNNFDAVATVHVQGINLVNAASSISRTGGTCGTVYPFALVAAGSCTVQLSFAPTVVGAQSATLQAVADTGNITVAVSGSGVVLAPLPTFAPAQLNYGLFPVSGGVPVTQTVSFTNPGAAPLDLLGLTGAQLSPVSIDPYRVVGGSCLTLVPGSYHLNASLAAGATCTLQVMFLSGFATTGNYDRSLLLQTGAGSVSVPMVASLGSPTQAITVNPNPLDFGNRALGGTTAQAITLSNPGPVVVNVQGINLVNAASSISRTGGTCGTVYPFALVAAGSCTVQLSFAPTVVGAQSATLQAVADTGNITVAVSGSGVVLAPLPTFAPAQLNYGLFPVSGGVPVTQTVSFTNPGAAPLDLLGLTGAQLSPVSIDPYRVVGGSCLTLVPGSYHLNASLAAGATCTLQVMFLSGFATTGNYDRSLLLQTGAGSVSVPMVASLGDIVYPIIVSPPITTFTSTAILIESRVVTLTNPAPVSANILSMNLPTGFSRSGGTCLPTPFVLLPAASCSIQVSRAPGTFASNGLKSTSYTDVPVLATTGNANLRIEVATQPLTSVIVTTTPPGLRVLVNGQIRTTPVTVQTEAGSNISLEARPQNLGNNGYTFATWSDSGAAIHTVVAQNPGQSLTAVFAATTFVAKLDVDNDGIVNAATDGLLIMRYLLGVRGTALIDGIPIPATAERKDATAIIDYLDSIRSSLDVDGVGGPRVLTDGTLILRWMLGLSGAALTQGVLQPGGLLPTQIQSNLDSMRP